MQTSTKLMFLFMLFVVAIGITFLIPNQSLGITYTEYDIISIDNERFTYVDSNNKIRSVRWCDYQRHVDVYTSDRTYVVVERGSNEYYIKYNLYLNHSDLK